MKLSKLKLRDSREMGYSEMRKILGGAFGTCCVRAWCKDRLLEQIVEYVSKADAQRLQAEYSGGPCENWIDLPNGDREVYYSGTATFTWACDSCD